MIKVLKPNRSFRQSQSLKSQVRLQILYRTRWRLPVTKATKRMIARRLWRQKPRFRSWMPSRKSQGSIQQTRHQLMILAIQRNKNYLRKRISPLLRLILSSRGMTLTRLTAPQTRQWRRSNTINLVVLNLSSLHKARPSSCHSGLRGTHRVSKISRTMTSVSIVLLIQYLSRMTSRQSKQKVDSRSFKLVY